MTFLARERAILAELADVLIPEGEGMPSAGQAGVAREGLDALLAARPDLAQPLKALLHRAAGRPAEDVVAELRERAPDDFAMLAEIVPGAYFMIPAVRTLLGYQGQSPLEIDPRPDYMEDDLLASVIRRGPIYRATP